MMTRLVVLFCAIFFGFVGVAQGDPFADAVVHFEPGTGGGYGQENLPGVVLGPPRGGGASGGSQDVLSLGDGGTITLEFVDNIALNGPGPDLIVFENPFFVGGNPENVFAEVAFVDVSQDGVTFYRFPNRYDPEGVPINHPDNWTGFAGVQPVYSHPDNGIDPTDPGLAGGDLFDLDDVGLDWIQFIRIIDTDEGDNAAMDDHGNVIYDPGMPGGAAAGFDLDAVAAIHSQPVQTPTPNPEPTHTPGPEPTATPPHTNTPSLPTTTPFPTTTPSPSTTPSPTPTTSAEPTPTTLPDFQFELALSDDFFQSGDEFLLETAYINNGPFMAGVSLYIILDVRGDLFFYPSWSPEPDAAEMDLLPGRSETTILQFFWPEVSGHANALIIWGGILNEAGALLGNIDNVEFGF